MRPFIGHKATRPILILIALVFWSPAKGDDRCLAITDPAVQLSCLNQEVEQAKARLSDEVRLIKADGDSEHQRYLADSQNSWLAYRQSECRFQADTMRGGSLSVVQGDVCVLDKTDERVKELSNDTALLSH